MLVEIEKVIVNDRIRKDFGNIEELAQDIKDNGLINPPVVTPELELIAGERRYRAMKSLGWQQIEVRVMTVQDALHKLKLEISENENRKDFSFNEKMAWAEMLKEEYSRIAKENMLKGLRRQDVNCKVGRTDDKVAKEVGFGAREKYRQAEYIYNNANEKIIKQIDSGNISIHKAYTQIKGVEKSSQRKSVPSTIKKQLAIRSGGKCEICGKGNELLVGWLHEHHIDEYSKTQDNSLENLLHVCPDCHGFIHGINNCNDDKMRESFIESITQAVDVDTYNNIIKYINQN